MRYMILDSNSDEVAVFDTLEEAKRFISEGVGNPSAFSIFDLEYSTEIRTYDEGESWESV